MAKPAAAAPPNIVALYETLVATIPEVKRKGAMLPYTAINGNMFSQLTKEGRLALRLPAAMREPFLKKYKESGPSPTAPWCSTQESDRQNDTMDADTRRPYPHEPCYAATDSCRPTSGASRRSPNRNRARAHRAVGGKAAPSVRQCFDAPAA